MDSEFGFLMTNSGGTSIMPANRDYIVGYSSSAAQALPNNIQYDGSLIETFSAA